MPVSEQAGANGKLTPERVEHLVTKRSNIHYHKSVTDSLAASKRNSGLKDLFFRQRLHLIHYVSDHRLKIRCPDSLCH